MRAKRFSGDVYRSVNANFKNANVGGERCGLQLALAAKEAALASGGGARRQRGGGTPGGGLDRGGPRSAVRQQQRRRGHPPRPCAWDEPPWRCRFKVESREFRVRASSLAALTRALGNASTGGCCFWETNDVVWPRFGLACRRRCAGESGSTSATTEVRWCAAECGSKPRGMPVRGSAVPGEGRTEGPGRSQCGQMQPAPAAAGADEGAFCRRSHSARDVADDCSLIPAVGGRQRVPKRAAQSLGPRHLQPPSQPSVTILSK
jgi:hypothetical protein